MRNAKYAAIASVGYSVEGKDQIRSGISREFKCRDNNIILATVGDS